MLQSGFASLSLQSDSAQLQPRFLRGVPRRIDFLKSLEGIGTPAEEQSDDEAKQSQDGREDLDDEDLDKPELSVSTYCN